MVIHDFDVESIAGAPAKADPVLVVHANTVLALAPALQGFQSVTWRDPEVGQDRRGVQHLQLPSRHFADIAAQPAGNRVAEDPFRLAISPSLDHELKYVGRIYVRQAYLSAPVVLASGGSLCRRRLWPHI